MQLHIVAYDAHILINQQTVRDYPSKTARDKTSAMRNVHILCSNCPSSATTQARSLFRHSPSSSLSHSSTMRSRSSWTSL